jgi:Protein of unknown function (DUF3592)
MWLIRFFEAISLAAGATLVVVAVRNFLKGAASRQWPHTQGIVLRSFVLVSKDSDGEGYTPQVEYEYSVEGKKYRGMRLRYGQTGSWNRKQAERIIGPYVAGSSVPVAYAPSDPEQAVLVRGMSWGNLAILASGLVFLAGAYLLETRH